MAHFICAFRVVTTTLIILIILSLMRWIRLVSYKVTFSKILLQSFILLFILFLVWLIIFWFLFRKNHRFWYLFINRFGRYFSYWFWSLFHDRSDNIFLVLFFKLFWCFFDCFFYLFDFLKWILILLICRFWLRWRFHIVDFIFNFTKCIRFHNCIINNLIIVWNLSIIKLIFILFVLLI